MNTQSSLSQGPSLDCHTDIAHASHYNITPRTRPPYEIAKKDREGLIRIFAPMPNSQNVFAKPIIDSGITAALHTIEHHLKGK